MVILQAGQTKQLDVADHLRPYEERADMVIVTAQALINFRTERADGIADFPVDAFFSSAETGELRIYRRIAAPPYYEDQGDAAAPVTKLLLSGPGGAGHLGYQEIGRASCRERVCQYV